MSRDLLVRPSLFWCRRTIHTSGRNKAAPWVLSRFAVALGARIARTAWRQLPEQEKKNIVTKIRSRRRTWLLAGGACFTGGLYYYHTHTNYAPFSNRRRLMVYSREDVRRLLMAESEQGEDYLHSFFDQRSVLPADHPDYKLCKSAMANILHSNAWCPDIQNITTWRLIVVNDDDFVNAISLPTGDVIIFTGMIRKCRNEDELGLIIGHEMAHIVLNHGSETLSHTGLVSFLGLFVIAAIWFMVPSDLVSFFLHQLFNESVKVLLQNPYSQKLELEADKVGLMLASKACYRPDVAMKIWQVMPELGGQDKYSTTHPCNEKRLHELAKVFPSAKTLYDESDCKTITSSFFAKIKNHLY